MAFSNPEMMTSMALCPPGSTKAGVMIALLGSSERSGWFHPYNLGPMVGAISGFQRPVSLELILDFRPHSKARTEAVRRFLASTCDWLIQLDNDVVLPARWEQLIALAEQDTSKLALSIPYPVPQGTYAAWNLAYGVGRWQTSEPKEHAYVLKWASSLKTGWTQWDVAAGGTLITHRSVFEKIETPYFETLPEEISKACPAEDLYFSKRLSDAGIPIHAHSNFVASHYHTTNLLALMRSN